MNPSPSQPTASLEASWHRVLSQEFEKPYMRSLEAFLVRESQAGKTIYPTWPNLFRAFEMTPFSQARVVILGQDPYHGPGQAHGLSFSVPQGVSLPPSLENIFRELSSDLGQPRPSSGDLTPWARSGVLLLNAVLTVEHGLAGSHQGKGWESLTDAVIHELNTQKENVVFILWGNSAQKKGGLINRSKHLVLCSPHPSPLSSHRGFFGSKPFSQTNTYLKSQGLREISWCF